MHTCRGLQLGASCCNRHIDWCPRDIDSAYDVSVHRQAACDTTKGGLTLAVLFRTVPTGRARSRLKKRSDNSVLSLKIADRSIIIHPSSKLNSITPLIGQMPELFLSMLADVCRALCYISSDRTHGMDKRLTCTAKTCHKRTISTINMPTSITIPQTTYEIRQTQKRWIGEYQRLCFPGSYAQFFKALSKLTRMDL